MRKYTTPTLEVVKLLVKEDMAARKVSGIGESYNGNANTTTYSVSSQLVSEANGTDPSQQQNP